jgi:anaerobic selenocysteine-containing dehydrogenase
MDRRGFFKIVSTVSAGVAASSCGKKSDVLIPLLVSDREIVPGEEQWHPSVCGECEAGCGTIVRVMEGERVIERSGQKFRERIACVKKIEGNPLDPVSGGRLCARGHAALQSLYNPDRVKGPMRRSGARGTGTFTAVTWDEAIGAVSEKIQKVRSVDPKKILFLSRPQFGSRSVTIQRFLESLGAPAAQTCSPVTLAVERHAAESVFGWRGLPVYDLARARYVLGLGADFLGGWASPVFYSRQFGNFRQGRPGVRGTLVQAESRMSTTAASADEWIPVRPGSEVFFAVAIARLLLDEKLARNAKALPTAVSESILGANLTELIRSLGVDERRLRRLARELGESEAPLVIAGASVVHSNSMQAVSAGYYLNVLLGNVGQIGGMLPPSVEAAPPFQGAKKSIETIKQAQMLFLDGEDPLYSAPAGGEMLRALARIETIVSFNPFIDDSAAYADFILPSHHTLESATAVVPTVSPRPAFTVATPFVQPLYDTRRTEDMLTEIARKLNVPVEAATPETFVKQKLPPERSWDDVVRQGGLWLENTGGQDTTKLANTKLEFSTAQLAGSAEQFPLQFQPYLSTQFHDGRAANLPWMQELPDPTSSAMWDLPVELDPRTAAGLKVDTGDWVRVESQMGSLEAPVYVCPAAIPGVISMAVGQGHKQYGRYASGRGANPLSIVAPVWEETTGSLAFGATRVRVVRLETKPRELIQFSPRDREQGPWGYR